MSTNQLISRAEQEVSRVLRKLPPEIRALASELPVIYQQGPDDDLLAGEFDPDILGLFVGEPHGTEAGMSNSVPPQIVLFLGNILDEADGDAARFEDEVRLTYLHELGHFLGWGEEEVEARGL